MNTEERKDAVLPQSAEVEPVTDPVATGVTSQSSGLDEKKRAALLRYMGILFGIAFLLVLLSFLIQQRDSRLTISELNQASNSALQNAEKLQDMNRALLEQNDELSQQVEQLSGELEESNASVENRREQIEQLTQQMARAEEEHREQIEHMQKQLKALQATELLMAAEDALAAEDTEKLEKALGELKDLADMLPEFAKARYTALLTETVQ